MIRVHNASILGTTARYNNVSVTVEDFCSYGRYVVKTFDEPIKKLRGFVEDGIFTHHPMEVDDFGVTSTNPLVLKSVVQQVTKKDPSTEIMYVIERVCGGQGASGGGCGAPLGVVNSSKGDFEKQKGSVFFDFREHNDDEVSEVYRTARDNGTLQLKLSFRPCAECRERY